jgi:hypothetical protein
MDADLKFVLRVAVCLIFLGLVAIGCADHFNWRDLAGAGGIVVGYGGGILQGKSSSHQATSSGSILNLTDPPKSV